MLFFSVLFCRSSTQIFQSTLHTHGTAPRKSHFSYKTEKITDAGLSLPFNQSHLVNWKKARDFQGCQSPQCETVQPGFCHMASHFPSLTLILHNLSRASHSITNCTICYSLGPLTSCTVLGPKQHLSLYTSNRALTSHSLQGPTYSGALYDSLSGLGWHWARGWHYAATPIEQREGRVVQPQVNLGSSYSNSYTCGGGRPGNCAEAQAPGESRGCWGKPYSPYTLPSTPPPPSPGPCPGPAPWPRYVNIVSSWPSYTADWGGETPYGPAPGYTWCGGDPP